MRIPLKPAHYRHYVSAVLLIRKEIGAAAPTAIILIQHELSQRDPQLIANEYLAWLDAKKKSRPRSGENRAKNRAPIARLAGRVFGRRSAIPADPSQN
jgi:hypothetical protein